jgi:hypothetical protein
MRKLTHWLSSAWTWLCDRIMFRHVALCHLANGLGWADARYEATTFMEAVYAQRHADYLNQVKAWAAYMRQCQIEMAEQIQTKWLPEVTAKIKGGNAGAEYLADIRSVLAEVQRVSKEVGFIDWHLVDALAEVERRLDAMDEIETLLGEASGQASERAGVG